MNKVDPCSIIDRSHNNTRWIYVLAKCHMKCDKVLRSLGNIKKMMMLMSIQGLQSKPLEKVQILTMRIKELKSNIEETV